MEQSFRSKLVSYDYVKDLLKHETDSQKDLSPVSDSKNHSVDGIYDLFPSSEFAVDQSKRRRIYRGPWAKSQFRLEHDFTPTNIKSKKLQILQNIRKKQHKRQQVSVERLHNRSLSPKLPRLSPLYSMKR
mmetsp:Transcript_3062/g.6342  ORF Transcript_3062/g.6342 Transcript_3062/m.6342 type:complete len:130 (+) Transcript_3062:153-542(+)